MQINDPDVLSEVEAALQHYLDALQSSDLERLDGIFWDSEQAVRFGAKEILFGKSEIRAFRQGRKHDPTPLHITKTAITTFGHEFATVCMLFSRDSTPGRIGRWSQAWAKFDGGWRITSAHVSSIESPR